MGFRAPIIFCLFLSLIYVEISSAEDPSQSQIQKKDQTDTLILNSLLISLNEKVGDLKYEINKLKDSKVGPIKDEIVSALSTKIDQSKASLSDEVKAKGKKCEYLLEEDKVIEAMIDRNTVKIDSLVVKTDANTKSIKKVDDDVTKLTSTVTANALLAQDYFKQILAQCGTTPTPTPDQGFTSSTQVYGLSSATRVFTWNLDRTKIVSGYQDESAIFSLEDYGMSANAGIYVDDNWVSLLIRFTRDSPSDTWSVKTLPQLYYVIKDQSGKAEKKDITKTSNYLFGTTLNYGTYYYWRYVTTPCLIQQPIYAKDNMVAIELHMDSPSKAKKGQSYNGVLVASVTNYAKCVAWGRDRVPALGTRDGLLDWIYSPYFYSSAKGYRMNARFDLYDYKMDANRKWLSCSVSLLTGENDAKLSKSFKRRNTLTIFNQRNANKHLVRVVEGSDLFLVFEVDAPDDVDSFILNDTIFYQVVVEAL